MFKYKLEMINFLGRNYKTFEQHFEKMAKQGWFVNRMFRDFFIYKKGEPKEVIYSFDFASRVNFRDGSKYVNNVEYQDFIQESGWEHITNYGNYNIFINHNINAPDLHSDDLIFYEMMNKDNPIGGYIGLLILLCVVAIVLLQNFSMDYKLFISWENFLVPVSWSLLCLYGFMISFYEIYIHHKNKKLLEMNILPKPDHYMTIKLWTILGNLVFVTLYLRFLFSASGSLFIIYNIVLYIILFILSTNAFSHQQNVLIYGTCTMILSLVLFFVFNTNNQQASPKLEVENSINYEIENYVSESSPFVRQHIIIHQFAYNQETSSNENLYEEYFDCRFDWLADVIFEEKLAANSLTDIDKVTYLNCDEAYYNESQHVLLARLKNQVLHLRVDRIDNHDYQKMINDYFINKKMLVFN